MKSIPEAVYAHLLSPTDLNVSDLVRALDPFVTPMVGRVDTIVLINDTRNFSEIAEFQAALPTLLARTAWRIEEVWELLIVDTGDDTPFVHTLCYHHSYILALAVYVLCRGRCNIITIDTDSVIPVLWDVRHMVSISQFVHRTPDGPPDVAMIIPDERMGAANAGIGIFPAIRDHQVANMRLALSRDDFPPCITLEYPVVVTQPGGTCIFTHSGEWFGEGPLYRAAEASLLLVHWPSARRNRPHGWLLLRDLQDEELLGYCTAESPLDPHAVWWDLQNRKLTNLVFRELGGSWPPPPSDSQLWTARHRSSSTLNMLSLIHI